MTLAIPEDLKKKMDSFPEMNWSEVARAAIKKRILMLDRIKEFTGDSEFTEEDAIKLGKELNKAIAKKYKR